MYCRVLTIENGEVGESDVSIKEVRMKEDVCFKAREELIAR